MTVAFQIEGQQFTALNGGSHFKINEAVSFVVHCESQEEVDEFWKRLSEGGQEGQCGWLKDKFGVSWQVVPTVLIQMLLDPDEAKSQRVMKAIFPMKKLEIAPIEEAYRNG